MYRLSSKPIRGSGKTVQEAVSYTHLIIPLTFSTINLFLSLVHRELIRENTRSVIELLLGMEQKYSTIFESSE